MCVFLLLKDRKQVIHSFMGTSYKKILFLNFLMATEIKSFIITINPSFLEFLF